MCVVLLEEVQMVVGKVPGYVGLFQGLGESRNDAKTWRADKVPQLKKQWKKAEPTRG